MEDRTRTTKLEYPAPEERYGHLSPKPVPLVEQLIDDGSSLGDRVLDPFGGTGTTLIAAVRLGRHCLMIEVNPEYCQTIVRRFMLEFPGRLVVDKKGLSAIWRLAMFVSEAAGHHLRELGFTVDDDEMGAVRLLDWWFEDPEALLTVAQGFIRFLEKEGQEEPALN